MWGFKFSWGTPSEDDKEEEEEEEEENQAQTFWGYVGFGIMLALFIFSIGGCYYMQCKGDALRIEAETKKLEAERASPTYPQ